MKKIFLKSKNVIIKSALAFLGFTLAASQCLAQYMAIIPRGTVQGQLRGITDSLSIFFVVFNGRDTLKTSSELDYSFYYRYELDEYDEYRIDISQDTSNCPQKYLPKTKVVAIKPEEEGNENEVIIYLDPK